MAASSRARIRTEIAKEFFRAEHGRDPVDARELAAQIAKDSRPRSQTVAGYDLTFSPVKSVSTLWAVADPARYALLYGSPVPGYTAPAERTTEPGTRVVLLLAGLVTEGLERGEVTPSTAGLPVPRPLATAF